MSYRPDSYKVRSGPGVSAQPMATEEASLIGKETNEHRTSNVQHRTSNFQHRIKNKNTISNIQPRCGVVVVFLEAFEQSL